MSYDSPDPYNQPEAFDLRVFGALEDPNSCYSFDTLMVWERITDGALFYASDSGCSCPSPFESLTWDELTEIDDSTESWNSFSDYLHAGCWDNAECGELKGQVSKHLAKVADALRRGNYVSDGPLRDAKARIESLESTVAAMQGRAAELVKERQAAVQAHRRLSSMLLSLGKEIELYMSTEAPQATDITIKVQS